MKKVNIILIILLLVSCQKKTNSSNKAINIFPFYVGTYTSGDSRGIYRYQLQANGKLALIGLAAESDNPSFLARTSDGRFLLAVNENNIKGTGTVASFLINNDSLVLISQQPSGGADPCFISVNKDGFVLVANYSSGNVGLLKLNSKGELSGLLDLQQHTGKGTTARQQGPHAHSAWFNPDDQGVIAVDLGTNELWLSKLDTGQQKLVPTEPDKIKMPPGAGPRHLVYHPNGKWIYVINELNSTITQIKKSNYQVINSVSTLPNDFSGESFCADIHISTDGRFLYASNRGHNSIAIFKVSKQNGQLSAIGFEPTHGDWPRNFSLSPNENFLLVANKKSSNIVSFKRDRTTGLLDFVDEIEAPNPVCLLF